MKNKLMMIWTVKNLGTESGFSLLEMLLVVLILSTLAFSTLDFVDNKDDQARFEKTRHRLEAIRKAIIGEEGAVYGGQRLFSGYAADNGLLPISIDAMITKPTTYDDFGIPNPIFDPDPDTITGKNNGGLGQIELNGTPLGNEKEKLFKGYRSGNYLTPPPSSTVPKPFHDGWNLGDAPDYGWTVSGLPTTFTSSSFGADGPVGGGTGVYDDDFGITVSTDDWQAGDIVGWKVTLQNATGTDIDFTAGGGVGVSLLVYENDNNVANTNWLRFTTNVVDCLDGDGDGLALDLVTPCPDSIATLTFPTGGYPGGTLSTAITTLPQGEHLLVVIEDDNIGRPPFLHNGSLGEKPCSAKCNTGALRTTQPVSFYARASRPNITVVIR